MSDRPSHDIQAALGYVFSDQRLLDEAMRHRSWVNEQGRNGLRDNERLEFLGDAVLGLVVGHLLMERHPGFSEGELSRTRAQLVNASRLAATARRLGLGAHLHLGRGERRSRGDRKQSILADALEAVVAAVYLDGGFDAAFGLVRRLFAEPLRPEALPPGSPDPKTQLQEIVQADRGDPPVYALVEESGPDHDKTFRVRVWTVQLEAEGVGKSKKSAEQDAARNALVLLAAREG
jgi:ribonuclease III